MTQPEIRNAVLNEARDWIGTPYRHQASVKGKGADCLGLLRGVWRAVMGPEPEPVPPYTPDWAERGGRETLRDAARAYLEAMPVELAEPGDVLLYRIAPGAPAKHCAILSEGAPEAGKIIHAYWGRAVTETWLTPWWRRRTACAFSFPVRSV